MLAPGDFGYIPPGTLHAYQLRGHYSTFVGPIVPGGWDRFFDLTGEPFATAAFPPGPKGPPPFEKFGRAEVEFKMKYRPDAQYAAPRADAADDALPGGQAAYFLRAGEGPRHELAGQLQTLLLGADQTGGRVTMTTVELPKGPGLPAHVHERTYESLMVLEGRLRLMLDGTEHVLTRGDTASIPAGHRARLPRRRPLHEGAHHERPRRPREADRDGRHRHRRAHLRCRRRRVDLDALRAAAADLDVTLCLTRPTASAPRPSTSASARRSSRARSRRARRCRRSRSPTSSASAARRCARRCGCSSAKASSTPSATAACASRRSPPRDLEELYVMRVTLEAEAIRLAVPRMTAEDLARLEG